jgi:outer membrane protein assembly factor BamB
MPIITVLLAGLSFAGILLADVLEPHKQFISIALIVLLTPLLLAFWVLFFSGLRWGHRFGLLGCGVVLLAGAGFGLSKVVRQEGSINGAGTPRYVWSWTPPRTEASLADLAIGAKGNEEGQTDLSVNEDTDYPQFLGRDRDGVARGVRPDHDWKAHPPKEMWRQKIGTGWSAFALAGEYALTQEQRGDKELVVCYELKTGKVRWTHAHDVRFRDSQGGDGPRATPTIAGDRVYTVGGTGILDCIDGRGGKNVWSRDTLAEIKRGNLVWGKSCSPLVFDDKVIVTGGKDGGPSLLAYHKNTGEPLWKAGEDEAGYSSPALATVAGMRQILSINAHSITSHDPTDGKVLWHVDWPGEWIPARVSQPVPMPGDRVFISAGYGVGCMMLHIAKGADGTLTAETLWNNRNMRTQFSNVVITRDCAFGLDDRWLACIDLNTGERKWKGERYEYGQVLLVNNLLIVQA